MFIATAQDAQPTEASGRPSSVRSDIFIATEPPPSQAPSGAACTGGGEDVREAPLLTELEHDLSGGPSYKRPAPNGASTSPAQDTQPTEG